MRFLPFLFAGLSLAVGGLAAEPNSLPTVVVTSADDSRTIELKPGQALHVVLDSNRTTGFSWGLNPIDAAVLTLLGEPDYSVGQKKPGQVGVGGTETWHLLAVAAGEQTLQFSSRRPFEPNVAPARRFTFKARVQP